MNGALARLKKLEVVETRQDKRESSRNICPSQVDFWELGMYGADGKKTTHESRVRCKELIVVEEGSEIYFNTFNDEYSFVVRTYDENKNFISSIGEKVNKTKLMITTAHYISASIMRREAKDSETTSQEILNKIASGEIKPFVCLSSEINKEFQEYGIKPSIYDLAKIEAVGENINLFDKDNIIRDYRLGSDGSNFAEKDYFVSDYIEIAQHRQIVANYMVQIMTRICLYDKDKNFTRAIINSSVIDIEDSEVYVRICGKISNINDMKLEKGSKSTAYSKYGHGSVETTTSNKNVLAFRDFEHTQNGITVICKNNKIHITGTVTESFTINLTSYCNLKILNKMCLGKTVCLSSNIGENSKNAENCELNFGTSSNTWYLQNRVNNQKHIRQFEAIIGVRLYVTKDAIFNQELNIQLELDEATSYIEHKGETEIMPIQKLMLKGDYFDIANKKEVHKKVRRIFDGTENWYFNYNSTVFRLDVDNILTLSNAETSKLSNYIESNAYSNKIYDAMYLEQTDGIEALSDKINIRESSCSTVEEFKAMLAQKYAEGNAVYADYYRKEPLVLDCTEEQIAVLNKLENMTTYEDKTIIMIDNDMAEMNIEAEQNRIAIVENLVKKESEVICENS